MPEIAGPYGRDTDRLAGNRAHQTKREDKTVARGKEKGRE
jgi:hypothetical protein